MSGNDLFLTWLLFFGFMILGISDWTKVEEDCRKAIEIDHNSVKVLLLVDDDLFSATSCSL